MSEPNSIQSICIDAARQALLDLLPTLHRDGFPLAPEWLSPAQVSVYCGFSEKVLEQYRRLGTSARWSKVGSLVRYRRSDVDAWLESCAVDATGGSK